MPSDILGSEILDETQQFKFIKGPVFQILFSQTRSTVHSKNTGSTASDAERSVQ
jgi:MoxR-like ATPase